MSNVGLRSIVKLLSTSALLLAITGCGGDESMTSSRTTTTTSTVTVPGAPTIGTATAGNASASIAFTAPASNGGATITGYTATCTAGTSVTGTGTASPITVSGLTNGTAYSCSVTATNSAGTSAASGTVSVTPTATTGTSSTASVLCPFSQSTFISSFNLTSTSSWTCSGTQRTLTANGIPNHTTEPFSNPDLNFTMTTQSVSFSTTLAPALASSVSTDARALAYILNGVKVDPGTGGSCASTVTAASQCALLPTGTGGPWRIEALGQTTFDFGADTNNAHVQPDGAYHYHGVPEGVLTNSGVSASSPRMLLIGWAPDGFPMYARYGFSVATNASSAVKVITSSYAVKSTPDSGRPAVSIIPMGAFTQDYQYTAGSGDLDECNGRFGVTPEFPNGIYHYYSTNTYPYMPRCWKGTVG